MLADFCRPYNARPRQRIEAWQRQGKSLGCNKQALELRAWHCAARDLARWCLPAEQPVLRGLEKTFKAFFARGRGFSASAMSSATATFRGGTGLTAKDGRIRSAGRRYQVPCAGGRPVSRRPRSSPG